jgi:hypothetical protein
MAKGVGKKINQSKIKPVHTKTIHTTSINKYQNNISPQTISKIRNATTQNVKGSTNAAIASVRGKLFGKVDTTYGLTTKAKVLKGKIVTPKGINKPNSKRARNAQKPKQINQRGNR